MRAGVSDFQTLRQRGVAAREGCRRTSRACLHSAGLIKAVVGSCAIDDVKACFALMEHHFKVGCRSGVGEVHRAPFNVKLPVRRGARDRGENAAVSARETGTSWISISPEVILIRENRPAPERVRQHLTPMGERSLTAYEVHAAVRAELRRVERLPVNAHREWE